MRVFTDTNFLVSALVFEGFSEDVFNFLLRRHHLVLSQRVLTELLQKLKLKFRAHDHTIGALAKRMSAFEIVDDYGEIMHFLRDKDDEVILASAIQAKCDCLLTGDKDLLSMNDEITEIEILSPRQFWEKYNAL